MNRKLTLNIDEELITFAHDYSKTTKQSISDMVEKYLQYLHDEVDTSSLTPEAQALHGILDEQEIPDKKELRRAFYEKSIN
jgi:hypothetical protein